MRLALIVPYFGKFHNYFQLVLNTCGYNKDLCDWLLFTDDTTNYQYPENVIVKYCKFSDIQERIHKLFSDNASIKFPYKLCDYKPAYGLIFHEEIKNYDFWGYCDIDCIFGKFSGFFDDAVFLNDRIMRLGHLCLYRNTYENNRRFMLSINDRPRYIDVFSDPYNCIFDEYNAQENICIDDIWQHYGFSAHINDRIIANVHYKGNKFYLLYQKYKSQYEKERAFRYIFYWDKGRLYRIYEKDNSLVKEEFLYMHLMKRKMKVQKELAQEICPEVFKIIPNAFEAVSKVPASADEFRRERYRYFNMQYIRTRTNNLKQKIKIFFRKKR